MTSRATDSDFSSTCTSAKSRRRGRSFCCSTSIRSCARRSKEPGEDQVRHLLRLRGHVVVLLRQNPRRHHLVEDPEDRLRHELRVEVAAERPLPLAAADELAKEVQVVGYLLQRR